MTEQGLVVALATLLGLLSTILGLTYNYIVKPSNIKHEKSIEQMDKLNLTMVQLNANLQNMLETDKLHSITLKEHGAKIETLDKDFIRLDTTLSHFIKDRV